MTRVAAAFPPEVASILAGRNPFANYSHPSQIFRDVFDLSDRISRKEDEEKAEVRSTKTLPVFET